MGMSSTPAPPTADLVAEAIARIAARRDVLDRLMHKGMEMIDKLAAGEDVEIAGRKPFVDRTHAYDVISRAVRICLVLANRLDKELIALLQGGPIPDLAILAPEAPKAPPAPKPKPAPVAKPAPEAPDQASDPRARIARAVETVIAAETGDREAAERMLAYVQQHLIEGEDYDAFLHQPWRVVVQTLCADLGLHPDWSRWDNTEGFKAGARPPIDEPLTPHGLSQLEPERGVEERRRGPEPP
jgi:pyruvate/2-oxoglutarate dehydrogenase complex dihydrolipoamide acyltransferase (E2) component